MELAFTPPRLLPSNCFVVLEASLPQYFTSLASVSDLTMVFQFIGSLTMATLNEIFYTPPW